MIKLFHRTKFLIKNLLKFFNFYTFKIISLIYIFKIHRKLSKEKLKYFILDAETYGAMFSSLKFALCAANKKKIPWNKIIFILPKIIINSEYTNFLKKNFKVNSDEILYDKLIKSPFIFTKNIYHFSPPNGWTDSQNAEFKFHFSNESMKQVNEFLKLNKIENNFVCISNRDNYFYNNKSNLTNYRNSNFKLSQHSTPKKVRLGV